VAYVAEQRHTHILEELEKRRVVTIRDLCESLDVTRETIRNDLAFLASRNLLRQVRGGAAQTQPNEPPLSDRSTINPRGKQAIARAAARLIPDGASLVLDSGSTTQAIANALTGHQDLTIYTNDIGIALHLRHSAREVHMLGGTLSTNEDSTGGHDAIDMISRYHVDFALIGIGGLSADRLFTDFSRDAAALRSRMIECATQSMLVVDHTKFGKIAGVALQKATQASHVVVDKKPENSVVKALRDHDMKLIVAT